MNFKIKINNYRRSFLIKSGAFIAGLPAISLLGFTKTVHADELPNVSEDDPIAVSLKYVHDASKSGDRSNTDSFRNNCQLYTGSEGSEWGPCSIFPGKSVNANGWCAAWVKKSG